MKIRSYKLSDQDACMSLFDSNTPRFFHPEERNVFLDYLESSDFLPPRLRSAEVPQGCMYVVESDDQIVGCGGWFLDGRVAVLSWGIVHQSLHRSGIGRFLLLERLKAVREDGRAESVRVKTTSLVQGFFQRAGFEVTLEKVTGLVDDVPLVELSLAF
jgi:N-acetylglutamate synthase-like GNAT family acetyltransferase